MTGKRTSLTSQLTEIGLTLPEPPEPNGLYVTSRVDGNRLEVSGQLSRTDTGVICGPIGKGDSLERAKEAARICLLRSLSVARETLGSLDEVSGISQMRGYIFAMPGFDAHSRVLDAASELALDLFGENGQHIRTAVGVSSLPSGGLVELEVSFYLRK
ncbi:MAG: RidA family protein [Pseudomonadota bacterium]